jgi:flavodoxin
MNKKAKIIVDATMTILLFAAMAYHISDEKLHKWFGFAMLVLFILHHILNWKWYRTAMRGKYTAVRYIRFSINMLLLISMIGLMVSGFLMSSLAFKLNIRAGLFGRKLHMLSAAWSYILISAHIGLHCDMFAHMGRNAVKKKIPPIVLHISMFIAIVYAIYKAAVRQFFFKMFWLVDYAFYDFEEPVILFIIDYILIMYVFACFAYFSMKLAQRKSSIKGVDEVPMKNQTKVFCFLPMLIMAGAIAGCTNRGEPPQNGNPLVVNNDTSGNLSSNVNIQKDDGTRTPGITNPVNGGKTLIAFFSWAYNAEEYSTDEIDVDAISQASVVVPGHTGAIAEFIGQSVEADTFIITVDYKYSADYDVCIYEHRDIRDAGKIPKLTSHIENLDDYDVVFLGFPNWNYGLPVAVRSFANEHDLSGKTVIPFVTHGTGGLARTITELNQILPDTCTILKEFHVYERNVKAAQDNVNSWLKELGYGKTL